MPIRDRALACVVAVLWGVNFPATELALGQFPPLLLVALRFALLAVPTVLLVPRPQVPLRWLVGYGLGFGVLQFLFLYTAMDVGMPPGLASIVLQSSAPFTVLLGALLLRERLTARRVVGVLVAIGGLAGIAVHREMADGGAPVAAVLLTLAGGLGWALGNLSSRLARPPRPLHLVLWMSVVPPVPMLAASLAVEGPGRVLTALTTVTDSRSGLLALIGLLYVVLLATVVGSGLWTTLLARHPSGLVAPFSMLVPVAGVSSSWLLLGDRTPLVEVALGGVVVAGVLVGAMTPRRTLDLRAAPQPTPADAARTDAVERRPHRARKTPCSQTVRRG
ncbi:EamA family transporter [Pseudokineococcus sp. 1T1Z-3]|uniref:EamA family transporter n=1 Tax=Pseudokineococcus sp. 1T1Z-3 TaxID=3132745 RepID=UPI003099590E